MSDSESRYAVFLSHDSRDKGLIELLAYKLRDAGLLPWFDNWELIPGNRWIGGLAGGINASDTCAVFIGPNNLGNWEAEEIDLAHTRAAKDPSFRVFPVLLPGVPDPFDENSLPPFLKTRTWVDFRKGLEDQRAFHLLGCGITGTAPGPESVSVEGAERSARDICPYRGLQVFNEEDARFYFGRSADIQRLLEKLKASRFLGVLGASGSGKSSLVRAGLVPALSRGDIAGSKEWRMVPVFSPGSTPLETLILNLAKLPGVDTNGLLGLVRDSERALHAAVADYLQSPSQRNAGTRRVLLVVDQLEEVFVLCDRETDREQFLANLLYAGSVPDGGCVVVVTMRADFYHKCAAYPEFSAALASQQILVSTMQRDGLLQAIQEPARIVGLEFEPGLVETIADDVSSQPGALPLLEHALLELWKRRNNSQFTLEAYIDTGRVQGAIAKRADAIYDAFSPAERIVMKRIMLRLTQPGEGTEDTRRPALLDELITRPEDKETVELVVDTLTRPEHRLLTADEKAGLRTVEVSHEALIRGWDRLRKWLDEDREGLRLHRRISEAARDWKEQTSAGLSDEGLLYRGLTLARALEWRKQHEADLNEAERQFLKESEALKHRVEEEQRAREQRELETAQKLVVAAQEQAILERKARVRQWYFTIGLAVLVVVISGLSLYAYRQYRNSRSRELATTATRVLSDDPYLSVLLAVEAIKISPTAQAEVALRNSLLKRYGLRNTLREPGGAIYSAAFSPDGKQVVTASGNNVRVWDLASGSIQVEFKGHTDSVISAAFSPDGKLIAKAGKDKTAKVWDVASGRMVTELKHPEWVYGAAFSPDGKQVVTACVDGIARIWEAGSGRMLSELKGHTEAVLSAAFSPDGKLIATAGDDKTARVWDVASLRMVKELKGHSLAVTSVAFSPDGKSIVTASADKTARLWEVERGIPLQILEGHTGIVYRAAFSPDGKEVVTASEDKTARVWEVEGGSTLLELEGHTATVSWAAFSPDGKLVLTASEDTTARVWETAGPRTVLELRGPMSHIISVAFSPDGKQVVTTSTDGTARVWEGGTSRLVLRLEWGPGISSSAVFSPDAQQVVTASDKTAQVWETASGRLLLELKGHADNVVSAAFSPDGKQVVTASEDKTARVWDLATGRTVVELKGHSDALNSAAFSPDGKQVVTASSDRTARIWEAASGRMLLELKGHLDVVRSAAFSPDSKWIVTASDDNTARIWDVDTGRTARELRANATLFGGVFNTASFSPDGKWIVTAGDASFARVWEAATGRTVLKTEPGFTTTAVFSPDGKFVLTGSSDGTARILECEELGDLKSLLELAKRRVHRQLTNEERRLYLNQ